MTKGTLDAVKDASPLAQLATVLILAIILAVQQGQGAKNAGREAADKEVVDTQLAGINATLKRIEGKLDQLDPVARKVDALDLRLNSLERQMGGGD